MADKQKYRAYPFTLNNYTPEEADAVKLLKDKVVYIVVGEEVGEQGTPHLQGFLYFQSARSLSSVKKLIPRAHFSIPAKGTPYENMCYCAARGKYENKPGWKSLLIEEGQLPSQGQRTDLQDVIESCKTQKITTRELLEQHTSVYAKYPKFVELCKRVYAPQRDPSEPPEVICYWGPAGSGKTRRAYEELGPDCYMKKPSTKDWFEGYDGHDKVIYDEADKGYIKLCELLDQLDRYPCKVNIKGSSAEFVASKIILTANKHPKDWYPNCTKQERLGLLRRMTRIELIGTIDSDSESESDSEDPLEKKSQPIL